MKRLILCAVLSAFAAAPAMADMVQNGSFESGPGVGSYVVVPVGSTAITGWTVVGRPIDYIGSFWTSSDGVRSLDMNNGDGPGGIEQVIHTTPGNTYLVTFDMAGNPVPGSGLVPPIFTMDVSASGSPTPTGSFSFDTTGHTTGNMGWTQKQWTFVAGGTDTTLRFMSTTDSSLWGPALDNVSVVPVPAAVLLGLLGLGAAGLRLRRCA